MIFQYSLFNISDIQYFKNSRLNDLSVFNIQYFKYSIFSIQYFQGWRTSRPDLPPHPSRNDQRSHSRHRFCHQPARKVGYCVFILILILMRLLIREAIPREKCSFFNIVQKAFAPPPFRLNIMW